MWIQTNSYQYLWNTFLGTIYCKNYLWIVSTFVITINCLLITSNELDVLQTSMNKQFLFNTIIILNLHFYFGILTGDCRNDRENCQTRRSLKSMFIFLIAVSGVSSTPWKFLDCCVHWLAICLSRARNYTHWMKYFNLYLGSYLHCSQIIFTK